MITKKILPTILLCWGLSSPAILLSEIPTEIYYQGKVAVQDEPFSGSGQFKFAIVDDGAENVRTAQAEPIINSGVIRGIEIIDGGGGYTQTPLVNIADLDPLGGSGASATAIVENGVVVGITMDEFGSGYSPSTTIVTIQDPPLAIPMKTIWSNDGTSVEGGEPSEFIPLTVDEGYFSIRLGDTGVAGMTEQLTSEMFREGPLFLRIWFGYKDEFEQLVPDQPLLSTPYALIADQALSADEAAFAENALHAEHAVQADIAATVPTGAISASHIDPQFGLWSQNEETGEASFSVAGQGGLRMIPHSTSSDLPPAIILGHQSNHTESTGATISGGGRDDLPNLANGSYASIGGGFGNHANGYAARVGGGIENVAESSGSVVVGGMNNLSSGSESFIGGGRGNIATHTRAMIGGGLRNEASGNEAVVGGGYENLAHGIYSTIGGGRSNEATSSDSTVSGGRQNIASSTIATVAGGQNNNATSSGASIGGGIHNQAGGLYSTVPGGRNNVADGQHSLAAGRNARAMHNGSFVWADSGTADFESQNANEFAVRAGGGMRVVAPSFEVSGNATVETLTITGGADLSEPFPISSGALKEGTVVVIDPVNPGALKISQQPYDRKVAGVISGANGVNPGIIMSQEGRMEGDEIVALTGRVYVQADASFGAIQPGDLMTTSSNPGHAMRVSDYARAQGATLGKAMSGLEEGIGFVLVLVTLQ